MVLTLLCQFPQVSVSNVKSLSFSNLYDTAVLICFIRMFAKGALCHKPEGRVFEYSLRHWICFNLTQPLTEMSSRKYSLRVKRGRRVRLTTFRPFVSRLSRKYGILDVSQSHRPPRSDTRIVLLFTFYQ
jgi:hypothetical protein